KFCPSCGTPIVHAPGNDQWIGRIVAGKYRVEELIGEEFKESASAKKPKRLGLLFLLAGCTLAIAAGVAVPIIVINAPKQEAIPTLSENCWSRILSSQCTYHLFTAFGTEEVMSLELEGDAREGTFVCQESWYESKEGELLNCLAYGSYQTEDDTIRFYAENIVDPLQTEKLKTHQALGIPYFEATYTGNEGIEEITFLANSKNASSSAFGRWTKYANFFSKEDGTIDFETVKDHAFSEEQLVKMPRFAVAEMGYVIPMELEVDVGDYPFYVGRTIQTSDFHAYAIYSDSSKHDVSDVTVYDKEGRQITPQDSSLHAEFSDGGYLVETDVSFAAAFPFPWDLTSSKADSLYFTHYLTGEIKAFGMLEIEKSGSFLYSEAYGKQSFSSFAVLSGHCSQSGNDLLFTVEKTYSSKANSERFLASNAPYASTLTSDPQRLISFATSTDNRCFFGYYSHTEDFANNPTTSFSTFDGEICFEKVENHTLSQRASEAVETYRSMIASSERSKRHERILKN
ncbi:MAG: hypothetical protein J5736_01370, partial [Bacilli bacterium]|nr:hypothetical protein [Bacilli bacterium]